MDEKEKRNKDKKLLEMFKKQFKVQVIINLINTALIFIFAIIFYKNKSVLIFLGVLLVVLWLYIGLKLVYLKKAISRLQIEEAKKNKN